MSLSAGRVGVRADQVDAHGRVISPSFLNEIMEDLPEWTDLPVRVNGTEELIPSNPSVPVTSPILADILYPDIRRDDQYFTYRESPTTVDGLAKIKSIKGNTLVWNQLVDLSSDVNLIKGSTRTAIKEFTLGVSIVASHKYLLKWKLTNVVNSTSLSNFCAVGIYTKESGANKTIYQGFKSANGSYSQIFTSSYSGTSNGTTAQTEGNIWLYFIINNSGADSDTATFSDVQLFDLTQMFGSGNEPTTVDEFTSFFPLPYYAYNSGSLLSFNGTGLKTTGKNLLNLARSTEYATNTNPTNVYTFTEDMVIKGYAITGYTRPANIASYSISDGILKVKTASTSGSASYGIGFPIKALPNTQYTISATKSGGRIGYSLFGTDGIITRSTTTPNNYITLVTNSNEEWLVADFLPYEADTEITVTNIQVEFGDTATDYEPYTENTTNLPIATYFPTGMKSVGTVYDELLPTKAITRIGAVDLGSLSWSAVNGVMKATISGTKTSGQCACAIYTPTTTAIVLAKTEDKVIAIDNVGRACVYDSAYTSASAFKTAMNGVYLYYELATPVELPTLDFGE